MFEVMKGITLHSPSLMCKSQQLVVLSSCCSSCRESLHFSWMTIWNVWQCLSISMWLHFSEGNHRYLIWWDYRQPTGAFHFFSDTIDAIESNRLLLLLLFVFVFLLYCHFIVGVFFGKNTKDTLWLLVLYKLF